jgi:hypothetical protein
LLRSNPTIVKLHHGLEHIGVYVHELTHYFVLRILGTKVINVNIKVWREIDHSYNGAVNYQAQGPIPFFKAAAVATAPMTLGTILLVEILEWWHTQVITWELEVIVYGSCLAILLVIGPSWGDYGNIWRSMKDRPFTCIRQVIAGSLAIAIMLIYRSWFATWLILPDLWYEIVAFLIQFAGYEILWAVFIRFLNYTTNSRFVPKAYIPRINASDPMVELIMRRTGTQKNLTSSDEITEITQENEINQLIIEN